MFKRLQSFFQKYITKLISLSEMMNNKNFQNIKYNR